MTDYSKSVIYKIAHKYNYTKYECYIGSTCNFKSRKKSHLNNCINENSSNHNIPLYQYIINSGGFHNWVMFVIENYSCNSKKELQEREKYWIKTYQSKLNKQIPNHSAREWQKENVERCRKTSRRFYKNNIEKERERGRLYYDKNKHLIREKHNETEKQRYWDNKEKINEYKKEKIKCDNCGCESRRGDIAKHKRTKKCLNHSNK